MKVLVSVALLWSTTTLAADWSNRCAEHFIPAFEYETALTTIRDTAKNFDDYINGLEWNYRNSAMEFMDATTYDQRKLHRHFLVTFGRELRRTQKIKPRGSVADALEKFEHLEGSL